MRTAFNHWLFDAFTVSPEGLGLYRITVALFALLVLTPGHSVFTDFAFIADLHSTFFMPPPGPMMLVPGVPPVWFFEALHLGLIVGFIALLFGYHTRTASLAVFVMLMVGYGFYFSTGKINHYMLFVLLPLVMSASNWGAAYSMDAQAGRTTRTIHSWPLALLALLVGFAMFTAGFSKLIGGWLDPTTQATHGHFIKQFFSRGREDLLAPLFLNVEWAPFWELLDWSTVGFEMGFLAAAFHPKAMRWFAGLAILFHVGTLLMMNISFVFNYVIYAAFIDWPAIAERLSSRWNLSKRRPLPAWLAGVLGSLLAGGLYLWGSPLFWFDSSAGLTSDVTWPEIGTAAVALLVVCVLAGRSLLCRYRSCLQQSA